MEKLWAPWRLEYIKRDALKKTGEVDDCPFCAIQKEAPSPENLVHYSGEDFFVVQNKFPYNPGHLLVIPKAHVAETSEVSAKAWMEMASAIRVCQKILKESMNPQAFNVGLNIGATAGAGLPHHIHWHLLPRWFGDTNFMPLLAETKAIPTHNHSLYEQLKPFFQDFAERLKADMI